MLLFGLQFVTIVSPHSEAFLSGFESTVGLSSISIYFRTEKKRVDRRVLGSRDAPDVVKVAGGRGVH